MLNIGIIGAGYWGPNLIRNFNALDNSNVKYVVDLEQKRLKYVAEKFPEIKTSNDYRLILEDSEISAVVIATPVSTHYKLGVKALLAGKHVFIEKPFTTTASESQDLIKIAEKENLVLMVGHLFEYHPAVNKIKEIINSHTIGDIYYIDAARINMGPPSSEVNVIWDLAPHDLSIILYLMDENPVSIRGIGNDFRTDQWKDLIQASYITLRFKKNKFTQVHSGWLSPNKTRRMEIFGSKGVILYDEMKDNKLTVFGEGIDNRKKGVSSSDLKYGADEIFHPHISEGEPLKIECQHFISCIKNDDVPRSDGYDGLKVVKIIEEANISINNNGEIREF